MQLLLTIILIKILLYTYCLKKKVTDLCSRSTKIRKSQEVKLQKNLEVN